MVTRDRPERAIAPALAPTLIVILLAILVNRTGWLEIAIACQDTQPKRQQLAQWYAAAAEVVEPKPIQIKVGDRLRLAKDLLTVTSGKVVRVLEVFGDWFETSWGVVSFTEVESGTWALIPPGVACET